MNNYLKYLDDFLTFDEDDKKLWIRMGGALALIVLLFSVFTTTSVFYYLERVLIAVMVIFLPGYLIMKLFLDKISFSDNRVADKIIVSFAISVVVMVVPYFLTTYLRPYAFNTDEEGMEALSRTHEVVLLLLLVVAIAFGVKYYQNRKNKAAAGNE
jgi:Zn-dependent protease